MASQDVGGIPISYTRDQSGLRLLELPPELDQLITSDECSKLFIKSTPAPDSGLPTPSHNAVLCTQSQTYQIRQVQTSNTVLVARSIAVRENDHFYSEPGLCAFATCSSALELSQPEQDDSSPLPTAKQLLDGRLPWYEERDQRRAPNITKQAAFADIPYSDAECHVAWVELVAFELNETACKPRHTTLMHLWNSVFQGTELDKPLDPEVLAIAVMDADLPLPLVHALVEHLSGSSNFEEYITLDRRRTIDWLGKQLLIQVALNMEQTDPQVILERWREPLPESWRAEASLERLEAIRKSASDDLGAPLQHVILSQSNFSATRPSAAAVGEDSATKRPGKSRNWHEKFKQTRT